MIDAQTSRWIIRWLPSERLTGEHRGVTFGVPQDSSATGENKLDNWKILHSKEFARERVEQRIRGGIEQIRTEKKRQVIFNSGTNSDRFHVQRMAMIHGQKDRNAPGDHDNRTALDENHREGPQIMFQARFSARLTVGFLQIFQTLGEVNHFDRQEIRQKNDKWRQSVAEKDRYWMAIFREGNGMDEMKCFPAKGVTQCDLAQTFFEELQD